MLLPRGKLRNRRVPSRNHKELSEGGQGWNLCLRGNLCLRRAPVSKRRHANAAPESHPISGEPTGVVPRSAGELGRRDRRRGGLVGWCSPTAPRPLSSRSSNAYSARSFSLRSRRRCSLSGRLGRSMRPRRPSCGTPGWGRRAWMRSGRRSRPAFRCTSWAGTRTWSCAPRPIAASRSCFPRPSSTSWPVPPLDVIGGAAAVQHRAPEDAEFDQPA